MKKTFAALLLAGATFLTGCGSSNDGLNEITGQQGNPFAISAPACVDDAYNANSNQTLTVSTATGVLANDTPNGATLTFPATSTQGGTVTGNADGSFTYTPATNFTGADSFAYTLTNTAGTATCTVNITVAAVDGFFVDAANGDDGTGNFTNGQPFATIQQALTAAPAGSDIVVRAGNYTGAITLENGDRLLGSGSVLAQGTAVRPVLTGPIDLADGCTVDFVRIANSPTHAIDAIGQNNGTVTNSEIDTVGGGDSGVFGTNVSGTWDISNNTITNTGGAGILLATEGTSTATVRINDNLITNNDNNAIGFITSNSSDLTAQITGNTMTGNETGFTFQVIAGGTSTSCYDIENNTNDDTYRISANDANPTLQVEQFDTLISVNNNSGTTSSPVVAPTSVADGTCGF